MPTYEYQCEACGLKFERFQSITAPPVKKCPQCNKSKVRRLIGTGAGLIFKGSGFYCTDYRSDSYRSAAKSDSGGTNPAKSDTPATSTGNGDAASPSKSESKPSTSGAAAKAVKK